MQALSQATAGAGLLLVGHGSRRGIEAAEWALERHARTIEADGEFAEVATATLFGDAGPATVLQRMRSERVWVVPVLMSKSRYFRELLPLRLDCRSLRRRDNEASVRISHPAGLAPALADLVVIMADEAFREQRLDDAAGTVLLVGHGSTREAGSRQATELQAHRVANAQRFAEVRTAYLEQRPSIMEELVEAPGPVAVVALFAAAGLHAGIEIRDAVLGCGRDNVLFAGPVGEDRRFAKVIASCVPRDRGANTLAIAADL